MKLKIILFYLTIFLVIAQKANACSGTSETALCNIIHGADFLTNGLIWIGEPIDSCSTYTSYAGNFEACQFLIKEILYGTVNESDSIFRNTDSLIWVIGGPSNLCYERTNLQNGEYLFASRFQQHYAYDSTFKGYSTFAFNADRFMVSDTMVGNFINDYYYLYYYPSLNLGPDTILRNQLQNLVDNCTYDLYVNQQAISIYEKNNAYTFNIAGDLTAYTIEVLDTDGIVVEDYTGQSSPLTINFSSLPNGLYFIKVKHKDLPGVYVERILKND